MSRTTKWYVNDGHGTGYFAPGWDNRRIARRTGVFCWIGLALAAVILGIGGVHFTLQYGEQIRYNDLKSSGVHTTGVVGPVSVEHSTRRPRRAEVKYSTQTTATLEYVVRDQVLHGEITHSREVSSSFLPQGHYPDPAWTQGQVLTVYADPADPERFVLVEEYMETGAQGLPRGAMLVLIFTAVPLLVPLALFLAGVRNVREARRL